MVEYIFFIVVVVLLFSYIVFKDITHLREIERLQLKLMSKDIEEYKIATEPEVKDPTPPKKQDEYVDIEDVPFEKLMKAEDNL